MKTKTNIYRYATNV